MAAFPAAHRENFTQRRQVTRHLSQKARETDRQECDGNERQQTKLSAQVGPEHARHSSGKCAKTTEDNQRNTCIDNQIETDLGAVTQLLATPLDTEGVGTIFNHGEAVLVADLVQPVHVTHLHE